MSEKDFISEQTCEDCGKKFLEPYHSDPAKETHGFEGICLCDDCMGRSEVTYTNTEEGKYVLNLLGQIISTKGMEVYKCEHCEELYGSRPGEEKQNGKNTCGLCYEDIRRSEKDAYGIETMTYEGEEE